jgi:GT2 family glycosyltransferase
MGTRVCAVVLTCNRPKMLAQCLDRLASQTRPADLVLVVDNGSDDETQSLLAQQDEIEVLRLPENIGGPGGFARGLREGYERGFDWIWLLDDDAFPEPTALEALVTGVERAPRKPDLMTSVVRWKDGSIHPMNRPWLRKNRRGAFAEAAAAGLLPVRVATSVSTMVSHDAVELHGYPPEHYEIWIDDIEWTGRILRDGTGYMAPDSVTVHYTPTPHNSVNNAGERFYFKARNQLWLLRAGRALGGLERMYYGLGYVRSIYRYIRQSPDRQAAIATVVRGVRDGLRTEPR